MSIATKIRRILESLPDEKQEEVLDFAEFIARHTISYDSGVLEDSELVGLWAGLDIDFKDEYIDEIRREMWQGNS